jgi:hypothetical protein
MYSVSFVVLLTSTRATAVIDEGDLYPPPIYNPVTQGCHIRTLYDKNGCTVNTLNIYISQNRWENEYATLEDSWEKEDSTFKMEFNVEMKDAPKCSRCEGECVLGTSLIVSGSFVFLGALSSAAIAIKSY